MTTEPEAKTCKTCKEERPINDFRRRPPLGERQDTCKRCTRRRRAQARREAYLAAQVSK